LFAKIYQFGKNLVLDLKKKIFLIPKNRLELQQIPLFRISKKFVKYFVFGTPTGTNTTKTVFGTIRTNTNISKTNTTEIKYKIQNFCNQLVDKVYN